MSNKIKFENRPTCSCGAKMKLVYFKGYYDSFKYWTCDNCQLDRRIQSNEIEEDVEHRGGYA